MDIFNGSSIIAVLLTTAVFLILTIAYRPTQYNPYEPTFAFETDPSILKGPQDDSKSKPEANKSFSKHSQTHKKHRLQASVTILVLGDIGRSPRMQYHALSLLSHGARVSLIGYVESPLHPSFDSPAYKNNLKIQALTPSPPFLTRLSTTYPFLFPLLAPLKALQQTLTIYYALAHASPPSKHILIQNPPAIPVLALSLLVARLRNSKFVIDWHNLGYSLLALRFPRQGERHPLVRLARAYEYSLARFGDVHFTVSKAMARHLTKHAKLPPQNQPKVLHDRPGELFQPYFNTTNPPSPSTEARASFLSNLPCTAPYASQLALSGPSRMRLLISPTSWTPDEDFTTLLSALQKYSASARTSTNPTRPHPHLLTVITGRGPLLPHYTSLISTLTQQGSLSHTPITTAFLPSTSYARLLASADLGISLHTSSSGLDLPMKVLDMFGSGLPVAGYCEFEAWGELVRQGDNGVGFGDAGELAGVLEELFGGGEEGERRLLGMREGVVKEGRWRWVDEWDEVAKGVFL